MPKYRIPIEWIVDATIVVEADNLEAAITAAELGPMPEGTYMDGSFEVREDLLQNNEEYYGQCSDDEPVTVDEPDKPEVPQCFYDAYWLLTEFVGGSRADTDDPSVAEAIKACDDWLDQHKESKRA
jgi:hypothetical protein